ncbi:hypothetical protein MNV49_006843 [Pseudohyphozyma bogoriensis]|nr:hypothetical protein MNV49_006843 [Pseudohyphozyma bogoriensis]
MSRLDRLLLLLDTGSTPSVRLTAARQLAQLAAIRVAHPSSSTSTSTNDNGVWRGIEGEWNEVVAIVQRILPYLQSKSYETRIAASTSLSLISASVGIWEPPSLPSSASSDAPPPPASTQTLSLSSFSLQQLLTTGTLLLSSSGTEYGKLTSGLSAEELARAQKEALSKLGLGDMDEAALGVDMAEELRDGAGGAGTSGETPKPMSASGGLPPPRFKNDGSSLKAAAASTSTPSPAAASPTPPPLPATSTSPSVEGADPFEGLSARERNKLKRKRKTDAKAGAAPPPPAPLPAAKKAKVEEPEAPVVKQEEDADAAAVKLEEGVKSEAVVIDPGAKARERELQKAREGGEVVVEGEGRRNEMEVKEGEWPWRGTVERLAVGLLSPNWETRHGSALGLKEVLKLQGGGGGRIVGLSDDANATLFGSWCEDLSTKLLAVFALDRFGDYVSDQVMAPVRESAAQALATLLPYMPASSVAQVQKILITMVEQDGAPPSRGLDGSKGNGKGKEAEGKGKYVWQVRHSGLLGLKYLVAVKGEFLRGVKEEADVKPKLELDGDVKMEEGYVPLKAVVDAAILGLQDRDDDVRSTAAATLTPITDAIVATLPVELERIVTILWECLGDLKDDLSSSVGGVMDLLANLLAFPEVMALIQSPSLGYSLNELIPRLFPFFRHTITSVRLAVLNTILVFLELPSIDHSWADERLFRLLFQNLIVEEKLNISATTAKAWRACLSLAQADPSRLFKDVEPHLQKWFDILTTPIGTPIDVTKFWSAKVSLSGQGGFVYNVDKAVLAQDLALVSVESIMRERVAAATALGELVAIWPLGSHDLAFGKHLVAGVESDSAFTRFVSATVVEEWARAVQVAAGPSSRPLPESSTLASRLSQILTATLAKEAPASYAEMSVVLVRIQVDCQALYSIFGTQGKVPSSKLPTVAPVESFGIVHARQVVASFDALVPLMAKAAKPKILPLVEEQHRKISAAVGYYEGMKGKYDRQVFAAVAGAVIALRIIPAKLTPLIRCITTSLKASTEEDPHLQARSARAIAAFIAVCSAPDSTVKSNPSDKLIKNLCAFLCQDESRTQIFAQTKTSSKGILTLEYKPARGLAQKEAKDAAVESSSQAAAKLVHRGAQLALGELAKTFGETLLQRAPKLWSCMSEALLFVYASGDIAQADAIIDADNARAQDLLDCLTVLPTGAAVVGPSLNEKLATLFPSLALAARSKFAVVRYAVARCFASLCDSAPSEGLREVVERVLPVLGDPLNVNNRRGAVELVSHIVELLDIKILPYVIFLVVPILGRMSDPDDDVRLVATNTFATLIKLVPLEAGLPDPPGFPAELLARRQFEREFLTQLLDGSKVEEYKIPIPISIDLRKYQRDGVSWLAFLAKYQLHGLLCDDMGLGKTLQSICILASKHHERAERHAATQSYDSVHLPSLVVCPPTLTGHWKHEIQTYATALRPLIYTGSKAERERLVASIRSYDVVIMSYDILRNDIEALSKVDWHYCILDEGHIIKNGKTKLTMAVKSVRAIHRLILSGTPIQNNVLELWSLFDFLMPGFLGSEKAFNERFGKPIAASRDAKSSSKEQEAGALALEALHKQVLPFLLRRLKEDVLDDLPPKIIQDYYCELSPLQKQLYGDFSTSQAKQVAEGEVAKAGAGDGQSQHIFQALQYLRKLVNHPALILKPDVPKHQAIMAKMEQDGGTLRDINHAPKLEALRQILFDCGIGTSGAASSPDDQAVGEVSQHRVLIFCQLKQMLDIVENDLFRKHLPSVTYMRMDGSTDVSKRHAVVQTFNADPSIDCLLLTTHVGGLGLNLTAADTVIFVEHDWNPMKDLQAMDRAHRLGQKKVVNVYRLIMRGTLEEKIMGLQRFKLNIASSVVTQQNSDLASLGTESILDLFDVSAEGAPPPTSKDQDRPMGQKAILDALGDLPEDEYQDLDFSSFTSAL